MEAEILSFVSNQGLAVGVSIFLIWWVTSSVSGILTKIAEKLIDHDIQAKVIRDDVKCIKEKVDKIYEIVVVSK